ncbi:MAG: DUF1295 domain-containing protein [Pseudomonadales bacterium]|nr:DUF1295 domain-containing protein [Pseudomonadales bacterium]
MNATRKTLTGKHILIILAIIAFALLIAIPVSRYSSEVNGVSVFLAAAVLAFLIQWLAFIPAYLAQTEHFFDLTGSLTSISLITAAYFLSPAPDARALLLTVLVCMWALRLGCFLFLRVRKDGSDGRFDDIKPVWSRFLMTWTLQGLWIFITLAAALAAVTSRHREPLDLVAWLGLSVWLLGFVLETVADAQKRAFRRNAQNQHRFIDTGLWRWSRHPNYFGEILLWIGIALIAAPSFQGWQWLTLISPVFVILLLTKISGIPMLEARAEKRWGNNKEYQLWKQKTARLIPLPPLKLPQ